MDVSTTHKIAALHRAVEEIASGVEHPDLTVRQLLVLLSVGSKTGPVQQQTLAEEADEHKSTMSKIIAVLAGSTGGVKRRDGLGLLTVDLDPADLRSRIVSLSKDGEKLLSRAARMAFPRE